MDITGIGEAATAAQKVLGMFFPDKTEEERSKIAGVIGILQSQAEINKAEAQSTDTLQHFRGGAGWMCVFGMAYNFIVQPILRDVSTLLHHPIVLQQLDIGPLVTMLTTMLGLGA